MMNKQDSVPNLPVKQLCAICEREKKAPSNGMANNKYTRTRHSTSPLQEIFEHSASHKYGNLPTKKHDDYFTQVTEPQWLRRGNLKESDLVCKRHLAILMRGVDRGCEGGCCSPLHRGARLCKPGTMKSIPPNWRRRFQSHPKIKEEDKSLMLLCWDCYKKHMDRMSKYGDPMGRSFANRRALQRSHSLIDTSSNSEILTAMKRYKSMEKLDSPERSPTNTSPDSTSGASLRKLSTQSSPPKSESLIESPGNEREVKAASARRTARGRRVNKGRRSPSPPNNISPVRTSVVHSRRRHSPHKGSKSPIIRSEITTVLVPVTHSSPDHATSSREVKVSHISRFSIDEGDLADTESPRPPPVPPTALFSPHIDRADDVIDVFGTRKSRSPKQADVKTQQQELISKDEAAHQGVGDNGSMAEAMPAMPDSTSNVNGVHYTPVEPESTQSARISPKLSREDTLPSQQEESTASADEMAEIFGHQGEYSVQHENGYDASSFSSTSNANDVTSSQDEAELEIPNTMMAGSHYQQSSTSGSDETGDTQVAMEVLASAHRDAVDTILKTEKESLVDDIDGSTNGEISIATESSNSENFAALNGVDVVIPHDTSFSDNLEDFDDVLPPPPPDLDDSTSSISDLKNSLFVSPRRRTDMEESPGSATSASVLNYSLSPQSFRRLESIQLSFADDAPACHNSKLHSYDDVRDLSHPMRSDVLMKIPRGLRSSTTRGGRLFSYERVPAEDVTIFPDIISFLDGVTLTAGEDLSMYPKEGTQVGKVDLKKAQNKDAHRTAGFATEQLVVRRGQSFEIEVELSEVYDKTKHNIVVELLTGDHPRVSNGTHIFLPIQACEQTTSNYGVQNGGKWSGRVVKADVRAVAISISPPAVCPIGQYSLYLQIERDGKRSRWNAGSEDDRSLIVLFNPWCIDDAVYMSSQADRNEYVVADTGCIYVGNAANLSAMPWIFGQYEEDVLEAGIHLLESCKLTNVQRGDPVAVSRALCRRIADGVVGDVAASTKRRKVLSTSDVMQQYTAFGELRVPDDQVAIAALLVSVFRSLGFPARPVTCVNCAVESDLPLVVNRHYSEEGHQLEFLNTDIMCPSYFWAGVWMSRVDLPPGFGGWQAVVASRDHAFSTGPTPAYAIKKGQTSCSDETRRLFSALNANKKHWVVSHDGSMQNIRTENTTASATVTKAVGGLDTQDITKLYKFPEGSEENKLAVHTAQMHCGAHAPCSDETNEKEVEMSLSTSPYVIPYGADIDVMTKIANKGHAVRHLTINIDGTVLAQDGSAVLRLQRETILAEVLAGESVSIPVKFNLSSALHKLTNKCHMAFTAFAIVREDAECYLVSECFAGVKFPDVEIQLHGEFKVGGEVTVCSKMRNPLPIVIKNAEIKLNTSGLAALNISSKSGKSVPPWQTFKSESVFRCQRAGRHTVVATFRSDHLTGCTGVQEIEIT